MILAAMQSAAIRLIGQRPGAFFAATNTFEMEISDLINEVAEDVAQYRDWRDLRRTATIEGDGEATSFDLPADYGRMLIRSDIQDSTSWFWGYSQVTDANDFAFVEGRGFQPNPGVWMLESGSIVFAPAPSSDATFPYITKHWARSATGTAKAPFTADTDEFLLPERLLILGLVWRWREQKKLDASGDQEAFIKALDEYAAKDGGSRIIRRNARRALAGTHPAWPWELG